MLSAIYDDERLLNVSYCNRQIRDIQKRYELETIRGYDITKGDFDKDPKLRLLSDRLFRYIRIKERLENEAKKVSQYDFMLFIVEQMVQKIRKYSLNTVEIFFSPVYSSEYTVDISIKDNTIGKIFSTEYTFLDNKVYHVTEIENEYYDGYFDTNEFVYKVKVTSFLISISTTIKNLIHKQLSDVEIKICIED